MRQQFEAATKLDSTSSVTMASGCMKFFRAGLMPNTLALTPHMGYEKHGCQSTLGRKFLRVGEYIRVLNTIRNNLVV